MSSNVPPCPFRTYRKIDDGAPAEYFGAVGYVRLLRSMSAFGNKADIMTRARPMSAFGGKADIKFLGPKCPLMTQSGHAHGSRFYSGILN
jgi:hypothetical protein